MGELFFQLRTNVTPGTSCTQTGSEGIENISRGLGEDLVKFERGLETEKTCVGLYLIYNYIVQNYFVNIPI